MQRIRTLATKRRVLPNFDKRICLLYYSQISAVCILNELALKRAA